MLLIGLAMSWINRFLLQRHVDFVVEGVVAAVLLIGGDAGLGEDDGAAEDVTNDPPGPGSRERQGHGVIAFFGDDGLVIVFSAQGDCSWCQEVNALVDHDVSVERCGEDGDGLIAAVPPAAATSERD